MLIVSRESDGGRWKVALIASQSSIEKSSHTVCANLENWNTKMQFFNSIALARTRHDANFSQHLRALSASCWGSKVQQHFPRSHEKETNSRGETHHRTWRMPSLSLSCVCWMCVRERIIFTNLHIICYYRELMFIDCTSISHHLSLLFFFFFYSTSTQYLAIAIVAPWKIQLIFGSPHLFSFCAQ